MAVSSQGLVAKVHLMLNYMLSLMSLAWNYVHVVATNLETTHNDYEISHAVPVEPGAKLSM